MGANGWGSVLNRLFGSIQCSVARLVMGALPRCAIRKLTLIVNLTF